MRLPAAFQSPFGLVPESCSGTTLGAYPAALRHGASLRFRLSENLFARNPQRARRRKRFSEPSEKAPLGTWERGTFASWVTRARFGQTHTGGNPNEFHLARRHHRKRPSQVQHRNDLTYTSFRLRVHGAYLDSHGAPYSYAEEHAVICVGKLDYFIRSIPRDEEIEVDGELRSRTHVLRVGGPLEIDVAYPRSEVVASTIRWLDLVLSRKAIDDTLIALYKPDPA